MVTRDYNDQDVVEMARRAKERGWHVRFIELMPLGGGEAAHVALSQFVPSRGDAPAHRGGAGAARCRVARTHLADEARNFRFADEGPGVVGFISPVSEPYCGACNRMRLTADGKFHLCLLNDDELDVKRALRSGGGLPEVAAILTRAVGPQADRAPPRGRRLDRGARDVPDRGLAAEVRAARPATPRRPRRTPSSRWARWP